MKNKKIAHLTVVVALSLTGTVLAAGEMESKTPPPASPPVAPASAVAAPAPAPEAAPAAPAQQGEVIAKPSTPAKRTQAGKVRPKNLDLRHCLELESNAAIAKCAGE